MDNTEATATSPIRPWSGSRSKWLAAVLSLACCVGAGAETLLFATGNDYPPFADETLPNGGMSIEIVQLVVAEMGHEAEVHFLPWKRGYAETLAGRFVGTFPYIRTLKRESDFLLSEPLDLVENRIFVAKSSPIKYETLSDLIGKRACTTLGYAHPPPLEHLISGGQIMLNRPPEFWMCFKMLEHGRTDFVSINEMNGWTIIRDQYGTTEGFKVVGPPVETVGHHVMFSKAYPNAATLLAAFNEALAKLKDNGALDEVIERHTARHRQN